MDLASGMPGFRDLNAITVSISFYYSQLFTFSSSFFSISHLSLSLDAGFSPAIDSLSPHSRVYNKPLKSYSHRGMA